MQRPKLCAGIVSAIFGCPRIVAPFSPYVKKLGMETCFGRRKYHVFQLFIQAETGFSLWLLGKSVPMALRLMPDAEMERLYAGIKEMILGDNVDDRFLCELVEILTFPYYRLQFKKKRKC